MHLIKLNKISLAFHLCADVHVDTIFIILDGYSIFFFQMVTMILTVQRCVLLTLRSALILSECQS